MLFKDGKFFQYFEGKKLACANLLLALKQDKRHTDLQVLSEGVIDKTVFNAWLMCCFDMDNTRYDFALQPLLANFDPYQWQATDVARVVAIFSQRHISETPLPNTTVSPTWQTVASHSYRQSQSYWTRQSLNP